MMEKGNNDFAGGMFADQPTKDGDGWESIPRDENGTYRVAVFTEPCKTSEELEARAAQYETIDIEFLDEAGRSMPLPLTQEERTRLADHFTPDELAELERMLR